MTSTNRWLRVIVASTVVAIGASAVAAGNALTTLPLLWFLAVCPGMPYVRMLRIDERRLERAQPSGARERARSADAGATQEESAEAGATQKEDPTQRWITAIGLSLALDAIVAEVLLYTDSYTAFRAILLLGVVACAGAVIDRVRAQGESEPAGSPGAPISS